MTGEEKPRTANFKNRPGTTRHGCAVVQTLAAPTVPQSLRLRFGEADSRIRSDPGGGFDPTDSDAVQQALSALAIQSSGPQMLRGLGTTGNPVGQAHLL